MCMVSISDQIKKLTFEVWTPLSQKEKERKKCKNCYLHVKCIKGNKYVGLKTVNVT